MALLQQYHNRRQTPIGARYTLSVIESTGDVVINRDHPQVKDNKNGFEGGTCVPSPKRLSSFCNRRSNRMVADTHGGTGRVKTTKTGKEQEHYKHLHPERTMPGIPYGRPCPYTTRTKKRWNLFYVGYETKGTIHGRVFRKPYQKKKEKRTRGGFKDQPGTVIAFTDPAKND